jgi:hypothetical protein
MQLEVLDWVIADEAKRPDAFSDKEKQYLQDLRTGLVKGGNSLPPGGIPVSRFR